MKIRIGIFVLIVLCFGFESNAYTHKKAVLFVDKDMQPDSLGYNIVQDLASDLYAWISSGQVVLWDSPEKKSLLSIADLKNVEARSMTSFSRISNVFIYEYWTLQNNETSLTVNGFFLTGSTFKGTDVIYGFVEFNPTLRELFQNTLLHVNADGNSGTTLYTALINMGFNYTLIYFGNASLVTNKSSAKIVSETFSAKNKYLNKIPENQGKLVEYAWDSTSMEQATISHKIEQELDHFFNSNPQEFFNYGGDQVYSFLKNVPIQISDFHVIETWTKDNAGKLYFTPQYMVIYAKNIRLQPIPFEKLGDWKLQYGDAALNAFLSEKNYPYEIRKVNETDIPATLAQSYKDALFTFPWNHILMKQ